jgi:hypothetical protein
MDNLKYLQSKEFENTYTKWKQNHEHMNKKYIEEQLLINPNFVPQYIPGTDILIENKYLNNCDKRKEMNLPDLTLF